MKGPTTVQLALAVLIYSEFASSLAIKSRSGQGFGASKTRSTTTYTTDPQSAPLVDFLQSQKADIENVEIGIDNNTGRRGLYAKKNFGKAGVILCKIPSDTALALADPNDSVATTTVQAAQNFLNMQQRQEEWCKPYLDMLPSPEAVRGKLSTPNMWTDDELELLEFPRLLQAAKKRRDEIRKEAAQGSSSVADLEYATWVVTSRALSLRVADTGETLYDDKGQVISKVASTTPYVPCLVPMLDMVNHSSNQNNAKWTILDPQKDNAYFALEALRPIPAGKEITMSYGAADSSVELLLNYGFVEENNPVDRFLLKKGGEDCIASLDGWSTSLEEDETVLSMMASNDDDDEAILRRILSFRIQMKKAYAVNE